MTITKSNVTTLKLVKLIRRISRNLAFTIFEVGALPSDQPEPFHQILDFFPNSKIFAFEISEVLCNKLNRNTTKNVTFYPAALGLTQEKRTFYETNHPACGSLYKPNEELISQYNCMEVAYLKSSCSIETVSLDFFCDKNDIQDIDFIKIDIQGAELEVFKGGIRSLANVFAIVSEVEFIPHYIDQPLFGDVCSFLSDNNLMFHKFLSMNGRSLKPIIVDNDPCFPTQYMWSDALFIRNVLKLSELSTDKLLKLGLIAFIYGSYDVTFQCIKLYDEKLNTAYLDELINL